ncbi:enhancer of polycomb homolog 1-like isoform X1 [Girardinichthys multiradiatus]|uniref:enhancer of polycomb homolog 1-like isoform X1 n=2 Tax=Girardinichthys multiradiatus TaxID=208333 RepID=UPI001FAD8167|nr:enhancer of polycomb homolog 1-like isoform X1 [Girardinichthys multiradiatus]XP_047205669.1 enhancer of polycomb homolog 1-like isoform X1 [Girardinichthys multiradiatus]XP_047205670.1 enhancer of polycomb homolog 1-like isoform X1 [Girardinichthys multiradiatus]
MSKLSFRARALDACKPLPVFHCEDLPDLHEYASINRAVPQMPTGMEKEEESEHHLQRAISAQQVYGEKRDSMVIPVPEAERNIPHYELLYPGDFKMPKQLIHIQPFSLDTELPDYDLDTEDETFVNKLKKKMEITPLQFEEMIDRLEKGSGQQLVSLQEAKLLLKEDDDLIKEVFDYWSRKRKTCKGGSLIPTVKQEKRDGSSTSDPYVAFRRRTEKMQTRKNRKNDEASYEKMLKLRRDLSRTVTILEMIKKREKVKRELLHLTLEVVEKRNVMPDFGTEVMAEAQQRALVKPVYTIPIIPLSNSNQYRHQDHHLDMKDYKKPEKTEAVRTKRKYEKKPKMAPMLVPQHSGPSVFNPKDLNQYDFPSSDEEPFSQIHSGSSEAEEENDPDGCYAFRRKAGCQYYACRPDKTGNWPWVSPSEGGLGDPRYRYCLTSLNMPWRCIGLARRRVGRGGRALMDRAHTDLAIIQSMDSDPEPEPLASTLLSSPLRSSNTSTSETNTSDPDGSFSFPQPSSSPPSSSTPLNLSRILLNIKACRWRHFRPRTLSQHPAGGGDISHSGFRDFGRTVSGLTRTLSGGSISQNRTGPTTTPVNAFTAEQYQKHQEQLALMQKQQLEQSQQQQKRQQHVNNPTTTTTNTQTLVSKTLDQASAQFAASALITTDQLLGFKSKEELVHGVNGVLTGAGVYKNLHLSSAASTLHTTNQSTHTTTVAAPTFLQPSINAPIPAPTNVVPASINATPGTHTASTAAALGLLGCGAAGAAPTTTQVLIGNNICLSMQSAASLAGRHIPRTLGNVPPSALKLSTSLQMPKVSGASSMDMSSRDNHDEDKPALNSIADKTVAMEVT